mgnify:CR=1 FL=1
MDLEAVEFRRGAREERALRGGVEAPVVDPGLEGRVELGHGDLAGVGAVAVAHGAVDVPVRREHAAVGPEEVDGLHDERLDEGPLAVVLRPAGHGEAEHGQLDADLGLGGHERHAAAPRVDGLGVEGVPRLAQVPRLAEVVDDDRDVRVLRAERRGRRQLRRAALEVEAEAPRRQGREAPLEGRRGLGVAEVVEAVARALDVRRVVLAEGAVVVEDEADAAQLRRAGREPVEDRRGLLEALDELAAAADVLVVRQPDGKGVRLL